VSDRFAEGELIVPAARSKVANGEIAIRPSGELKGPVDLSEPIERPKGRGLPEAAGPRQGFSL
jgi:hypothetical protein